MRSGIVDGLDSELLLLSVEFLTRKTYLFFMILVYFLIQFTFGSLYRLRLYPRLLLQFNMLHFLQFSNQLFIITFFPLHSQLMLSFQMRLNIIINTLASVVRIQSLLSLSSKFVILNPIKLTSIKTLARSASVALKL